MENHQTKKQFIENCREEAKLLQRLASGVEQGLDLETANVIYEENSPF